MYIKTDDSKSSLIFLCGESLPEEKSHPEEESRPEEESFQVNADISPTLTGTQKLATFVVEAKKESIELNRRNISCGAT